MADFILDKDALDKALSGDDGRQNANVDGRTNSGRMGEFLNIAAKEYALRYIMSDLAKRLHEDNIIYMHDLSAYASGQHNCLTLSLDGVLKNGVKFTQTDLRPAQSIGTAMQIAAIVVQSVSQVQFGGCSINHIDTSFAPYVTKSYQKWLKELGDEALAWRLTEKETYQSAEGLVHNFCSLQSRSGNQLPFSSINLGLDTTREGRLVTRAILTAVNNGTGKAGRTALFPNVMFQRYSKVNSKPGTPNYDLYRLAIETSAKRLWPTYLMVDNYRGYDPTDVRTTPSAMGVC